MIDSLAYIGFTSPNAQAWTTFGPEVLGLQVAAPLPDGAVRLRNDDAAWRITIHPGNADDLAYLGWTVSGPAALAAATGQLTAAGIEVHHDDGTLAAQRMVSSLAWFTDPFGFRHELAFGLATEPGSFNAARPGVRFITGDEGLGHAVLIVPDWDAATQFFVDLLGFRVSDDIEDGVKVRFLHCNPRHHSLAFTAVPGMTGFHHLMLEVTDPDQVRQAYELVEQRGLPVAMSLGKHTNDEMFSFYVRTPSGFEIEYGAGGRVIDMSRPWHVGHYAAMSTWGHQPPATPLLPGILHAAAKSAS
ncbi:MAG TPA: VOC family protein [Mycobacterium sp.]|nr:VOC family protein [Mycobacterium sp.]